MSIGTDGGLLWTRWWTLGFHKWQGISWPAERTIYILRRTVLHVGS
jgi:hypothetical protein